MARRLFTPAQPTPIVQTQSGGPSAVIVPLRALTSLRAPPLRVVGNRPVIFAATHDITVLGSINVTSNGTTPAAGGNWSCGSSQSGNGSGDSSTGGGGAGRIRLRARVRCTIAGTVTAAASQSCPP